ncbi:hypothetical protein, partial [Chitinivorax sp. B]|uniref:hypothetical protein n=1 Tax=Chitinivorax sp. B TaxID=2502235 RepID=UPI0010F7F1CA
MSKIGCFVKAKLASLALMFVVGSASAARIEFTPPTQSAKIADSVRIDVAAGDLGSNVVGAFDFIVSFDASILNFKRLTFGSGLGNPDMNVGDAFADFSILSPGKIAVSEVSLLSDLAMLQSLQHASFFSLISLEFDAIAEGTAFLNVLPNIAGQNMLGDFDGHVLLPITVGAGQVTVTKRTPPPTGVPLPGVLALMLVGGGAMFVSRKRRLGAGAVAAVMAMGGMSSSLAAPAADVIVMADESQSIRLLRRTAAENNWAAQTWTGRAVSGLEAALKEKGIESRYGLVGYAYNQPDTTRQVTVGGAQFG